MLGLLGLRPYQRRTDRLSGLTTALATEVAYRKAARFLSELTGMAVSPRTIRNDVIASAPDRLGSGVAEVPILLLDGTGERAGAMLRGTNLHLALGLVARRRRGRRIECSVELLGATLDEKWDAMGRLRACQVLCVRLRVHVVGSRRPGKLIANALSACFQPWVPVPRSPPLVFPMFRIAR